MGKAPDGHDIALDTREDFETKTQLIWIAIGKGKKKGIGG